MFSAARAHRAAAPCAPTVVRAVSHAGRWTVPQRGVGYASLDIWCPKSARVALTLVAGGPSLKTPPRELRCHHSYPVQRSGCDSSGSTQRIECREPTTPHDAPEGLRQPKWPCEADGCERPGRHGAPRNNIASAHKVHQSVRARTHASFLLGISHAATLLPEAHRFIPAVRNAGRQSRRSASTPAAHRGRPDGRTGIMSRAAAGPRTVATGQPSVLSSEAAMLI